MDKIWPTLYKATSKGAIQFWKIRVIPSFSGYFHLVTHFGQMDSPNTQETSDLIKEGKNVGKANETTPEQQAHAEAQSKWEKMKKKGYVEELERAESRDNDLEGIPAMLAHEYGVLYNGVFTGEQNHKIKFPAAVQPKLDGLRCLTRKDSTLWSRSQKPIPSVPHIQKFIKDLFGDFAPNLDGELYNHDMKDNFEKIVSIVRQTKKVDPEHELVQYHVYDVALPEHGFGTRSHFLSEVLGSIPGPIRIVPTLIVHSHEEVLESFRKFRELGYEGVMVRNLDSPYEGKRSYNLLKLKEFYEAEFKIVDALEGRGKLQGHVGSFMCLTEDGTPFEAKMEGDHGNLKNLYENPALWKNRLLTVRYQGITTKNKVPRFPVGLRIREEGL